jgi:hypothetical protein
MIGEPLTNKEKIASLQLTVFDLQRQLVALQKTQLMILERLGKIQAGNTRHSFIVNKENKND